MPKISRVEVFQVDLAPKVLRSDAIQAFSKQETPMVRVWTDDGVDGTGYSYTIGTGGSAVVALLRDYMAPWLLGRDAEMVEEIWKGLFFYTHANSVGATVSLALAAVDIALWDLRSSAHAHHSISSLAAPNVAYRSTIPKEAGSISPLRSLSPMRSRRGKRVFEASRSRSGSRTSQRM